MDQLAAQRIRRANAVDLLQRIVNVDRHLLWGKSESEVSQLLGPDWIRSNYGRSGTGFKFQLAGFEDITVIFHQGGRHVGDYWKLTSGEINIVKLVSSRYRSGQNERARIIRMD